MQCRNEQKERDSWAAISNTFLVNDSEFWLFFQAVLTLNISHWYGHLSKLKLEFIAVVSLPYQFLIHEAREQINSQ